MVTRPSWIAYSKCGLINRLYSTRKLALSKLQHCYSLSIPYGTCSGLKNEKTWKTLSEGNRRVDVDGLKDGRVQRRFTRMIPKLKDTSYAERLDKLNLWSLGKDLIDHLRMKLN